MTWAPDYGTVTQLRDYVSADPDSDVAPFLALWLTTASRNVDLFCARQFGKVALAETRFYPSGWDRHLGEYTATIDDLMDTTGFTVTDYNGTVLTAADYELRPLNAPAKGKPYTEICLPTAGRYGLLGLWGWNTAPSAVTVGMLLQGSRLNKRRDSPFGIAGSPQQGSEIRLLAQLDPDFKTSLRPYVRPWWAA